MGKQYTKQEMERIKYLYGRGYSYQDIADALGRTPGAIGVRIHSLKSKELERKPGIHCRCISTTKRGKDKENFTKEPVNMQKDIRELTDHGFLVVDARPGEYVVQKAG